MTADSTLLARLRAIPGLQVHTLHDAFELNGTPEALDAAQRVLEAETAEITAKLQTWLASVDIDVHFEQQILADAGRAEEQRARLLRLMIKALGGWAQDAFVRQLAQQPDAYQALADALGLERDALKTRVYSAIYGSDGRELRAELARLWGGDR